MGSIFFSVVSFLPASWVNFDKSLFQKVNGTWHNSFLDTVMPYVREPFLWTPFYFFLILLVVFNFGIRGWMWIVFILVTVVISDYTSSSIVKEAFFRLRPCRDPEMANNIRFLVRYCPISSSFVSSHAVNHFAISTFIFVTFKNAMSRKWAYLFLWPAAISYAQVYVGVHYPIDVICGTLLGILLGLFTSYFYNKWIGLEVKAKMI